MRAFVIAQINVTDPDQYRAYTEHVPATIASQEVIPCGT